ncbi:programmed cell death protein 2 [Flagelloscypha sp. PMI_526]|nr:programmed cell death protein 2 [Flagelloscypha sp. PMI_526]
MPRAEDDWDSDDDSEFGADGVDTSVHLGLPDGSVEDPADLRDAAVSRIGGSPALLTRPEPPFSSSFCKICNQPMELLVQLLSPFEDSPFDRALYIWGCSKPSCQTKSSPKGGSVRAWRGLRYNSKYAAKLEARKRRKAEAEAAARLATAEKIKPKVNPFSKSSASANPSPFGGGFGQGFGAPETPKPSSPSPPPAEDESDSDSDAESDTSSLNLALESSSLTASSWSSCPTYPPLYLSTQVEYLPTASDSKSKLPKGVEVQELDPESTEGGATWGPEAYENSLNVDQVFERFTKRVAAEGEQCVRYELGGTPLPFSSDQVFDALFPKPTPKPGDAVPVTRGDFKVTSTTPQKRVYSLSSPKAQALVPPCPLCSSSRTFECQIMPNLLNLCRKPAQVIRKVNEETGDVSVITKDLGMEWGTCLVFSCEKDCCLPEGNKECWVEEVVLIQWDH